MDIDFHTDAVVNAVAAYVAVEQSLGDAGLVHYSPHQLIVAMDDSHYAHYDC